MVRARICRRLLAAGLGRVLLIVAAATMLGGCDIGYLAHAAYEQGRLLWHREPISKVLARPTLAPDTRAKLETVLAVRKFAAERLGLNVGHAYET
ncbi:MAG: aminopeptidase, partial [Deltaproteobacteria bacterium]|nr:aminopeptidase [Deltaproteobacteria bacterium]